MLRTRRFPCSFLVVIVGLGWAAVACTPNPLASRGFSRWSGVAWSGRQSSGQHIADCFVAGVAGSSQ